MQKWLDNNILMYSTHHEGNQQEVYKNIKG